jgi:hypothetical protein
MNFKENSTWACKWLHQLPVMAEKKVLLGVPEFERKFGRVLKVRQVVAGKSMAQSVGRPSF